MTASPASSSSAERQGQYRPGPSNGYLFVVTGLAVFFSALVLGLGFRPHDPVHAVVAPTANRAVAPLESAAPFDAGPMQTIAARLQSEATIGQTLEILAKYDASAIDRALTPAKFLRDFTVLAQPGGASGGPQLLLNYRGTTPGAREIVNQLAILARPLRTAVRAARQQRHYEAQQAAGGRTQASAALQRYELFIAKLQPDQIPAATTLAASPFVPGGVADSPASMIPNPLWSELSAQQERLTRRRAELLESMTSEHPAVRQLNDDLAQVAQSLAQTPRLIENPAALAGSRSASNAANAPAIEEPSNPDQLQAETVRLRAESVAADRLVVQRQAELQASAERLAIIQAQRLEVARWAEKPAAIRGSDGVTLIVAGLLAWLVASSVASRGVPEDPNLVDPDDAAAALATPVLAVLPASERSPLAEYPQLPRATRWIARASEFALATMLFMALTLVIADQSFRARLFSHPLSSIPHGIERFRDMLG